MGKKASWWSVRENSGGVAILLGSSYPVGEIRILGCIPIYWGIIRRLGTKVNCYLVNSQTLRQLVGAPGKTEWFLLGIKSLKF